VKINAYLEQVLGFTNVSRLAGGVISYTRELEMLKEKEREEQGGKEGVKEEEDEGGFTMISKQKNNEVTSTEIVTESSNEENIHLTRNVVGSKFKVPVTSAFYTVNFYFLSEENYCVCSILFIYFLVPLFI
jgi:hypothetical protein